MMKTERHSCIGSLDMTEIQSLFERLNGIEATIAQATRTDGTPLSEAAVVMLESLEHRRDELKEMALVLEKFVPPEQDKITDLQAKLDKAVEALQEMLSRRRHPIGFYWRNGAQFTSEYGNEYESTSDVISSCKEDVGYLEAVIALIAAKSERDE